ncbi:Glutaredoxin-family domain-containing protein [Marinobacter sp. LV10R510-11A]|uniref:glutaredoxin domain-containing protein n=1 Tax=Marinobacter sp. LV10R510-11A TaxID=1415568 RepID=UPI000BB68426|nr:glutaredoxin domain-containing protein [Marinobacter sp. LV10R510-11A]SOB78100.1 Glutaredoxin-family domain-containing protein [Marinobacter sp. LV10R510-11A]
MTNPASIGQPLDRVDGPLKVSGRATYAAEHAFDQPPLVGWIVEATIPAGRIKHLDTRAAENSTGVVAVLTHHNSAMQTPFGEPGDEGRFTQSRAMLFDDHIRYHGFGDRSWRYSMLVKNGTIEKMFIEPDKPGDPFGVSDADTMLHYIKPDVTLPARVSLFSKPGCPHCTRAKTLLQSKGYKYEEIMLGAAGLSYSTLQAVTGRGTTPQIFIDGQLIGGADELEALMATR